jgi:RNA polymerase sigma-70 factor (ECF subfamily)
VVARADFPDFYAAHFARIVGELYLLIGDHDEAEEVAQEAFARAYTHWHRISGYDLPQAWVRRVAVNYASSRRRRAIRASRALLRFGPTPPQPAAEPDAVAVVRALAKLPLPQRRAMVLFYVGDRTVRDIAAEMSVPEGTIKTWLRRGRQRLRELVPPLADDDYPPDEPTATRV